MKIILFIDHPVVEAAALLLMKHYNDYKFLEKLRTVRKFNHTGDSGTEVANKLRDTTVTVEVVGYKSAWPWSKSTGHAKFNLKTNTVTIHVNMRKVDQLTRIRRAGNFMHELIHGLGYSHDGNTPSRYNALTVPYAVGAVFENYLSEIYDS